MIVSTVRMGGGEIGRQTRVHCRTRLPQYTRPASRENQAEHYRGRCGRHGRWEDEETPCRQPKPRCACPGTAIQDAPISMLAVSVLLAGYQRRLVFSHLKIALNLRESDGLGRRVEDKASRNSQLGAEPGSGLGGEELAVCAETSIHSRRCIQGTVSHQRNRDWAERRGGRG